MKRPVIKYDPVIITAVLFFTAHFFYFLLFNRYHLYYQEEIQLFRFDWNYFSGFLERPGGVSDYLGSFLIQFYVLPGIGPLIVTIASMIVYFLSRTMFKRMGLNGLIWSLIPVLFVVALQNDYVFYIGYTVGIILIIGFIACNINIINDYQRYMTAIWGLLIFYPFAGDLIFFAALMLVMYEILFKAGIPRFLVSVIYIMIVFAVSYIARNYIYLIPSDTGWLTPLIKVSNLYSKLWLILLLSYYPSFFIIGRISRLLPGSVKKNISGWDIKPVIAGMVIFSLIMLCVIRYSYDKKSENLFGIDHNVQNAEWERALSLAQRSPGNNRIVVYLTNIALYNTGQMGDRLFHYNQIGSSGLFLGWGEDAAPFFGCELFYQLGYINEAYRWAFEALVAKGESPRILKILTLASLINGNNAVAAKFLNILDRSLFYADWAEQYRKYINDPVMLGNDPEISAKRRQLIKTDFFADVTRYDLQLTRLLENNPDNRMAFEYLISFLLLEKNLSSFSEKMKYLNDLGYKQIPVHFEEALLASDSGYEAFIPEGLSIRESTRHNFDGYVKASPAGSYSIDKRMEYLGDQYGNTFWYYYQFK